MAQNVRIIGGKWRGRKIQFPDHATLRPTPNRVRETLFNWLMHDIQGATCLDMFAGSGGLSFEALSRGAKQVTLWESSKKILASLKSNAKALQIDESSIEIEPIQFPYVATEPKKFDVVFLDPPFHKGYIQPACQWLIEHHALNKDALIYIEAEADLNPLPIPETWEIIKSKQAGEVCFYLVRAIN